MAYVSDQPAQNEAGESLEWRVWPAREKIGTAVAVIAVMLVCSLVAMHSFQSGWYAFMTLAGLTLALAEWLFPTAYRLDGAGVRVRGPFVHIEREWEAFRATEVLADRVILSPLTDTKRWIARRRSVALRVEGNRDEVLAFVARHVPVKQDD